MNGQGVSDMQENTSGYTDKLDIEMETPSMPVDDKFSSLHCFYVSPHGHTRLFYASRYGKLYVLKCLKPDYLYIPLYRQALVKEFEIGLQLDHPYICRTIGMEEVEGLGSAIVMECIDGCTLKSLIDKRQLTPALARKIIAQASAAIDYMHSKQIIHRDLKPSNIMVTHNGHNVKIVDFSLADGDMFVVLKQPGGTSGYIAPELLQKGAKSDVRCDVYSFGKVMQDMAALIGDNAMVEAAEKCTCRNVAERPSVIPRIKGDAADGRKRSGWFVAFSLIAIGLVAFVIASIIAYVRGADIQSDGNDVTDMSVWVGNID